MPGWKGRRIVLNVRQLYMTELLDMEISFDEVDVPETYGDCNRIVGDGPCPFVRCRYHLAIEIEQKKKSGEPVILHTHGVDADITELRHTCALKCAERGGMSLQEIGDCFGVTRERARQMIDNALENMVYNCGPEMRQCKRWADMLREPEWLRGLE